MNTTTMDTTLKIPSHKRALKALLRADFTVMWRQRKALVMSLVMPIIFLFSWKGLIPVIGANEVLSSCLAIGLPSTGLLSYSLSVARDREKGVFQRLRSAPVTTTSIMGSRIIVQIAMILFMTICTLLFAYFVDKIHFSILSFILILPAALLGGLSFVALGQFVVGLFRSSESVNAAARLLYFPLSVISALGGIGLFGKITATVVEWSPFGTTRSLLTAALDPHHLTMHLLWAVLATIGYGIVFAGIGIKRFNWSVS